jgi:hypothetical protein
MPFTVKNLILHLDEHFPIISKSHYFRSPTLIIFKDNTVKNPMMAMKLYFHVRNILTECYFRQLFGLLKVIDIPVHSNHLKQFPNSIKASSPVIPFIFFLLGIYRSQFIS